MPFKLIQLCFVRSYWKSTFQSIVPSAVVTLRCGLVYQVHRILVFDVRCPVATEIFQCTWRGNIGPERDQCIIKTCFFYLFQSYYSLWCHGWVPNYIFIPIFLSCPTTSGYLNIFLIRSKVAFNLTTNLQHMYFKCGFLLCRWLLFHNKLWFN